MVPLGTLAVDDVASAIVAFRDGLLAHRDAINALNVYPVPDGDTGTNMSLTLGSVVEELESAGEEAAAQWSAIRHGSLMGARGNSGVIMAAILRGLVDELSGVDAVDGPALAEGLHAAATAAYEAVGTPIEGTILTVVREASHAAAASAADKGALLDVVDAAIREGEASLERTPTLLQVLADAGVVDAGGAGFLLFLHALAHVIDGRPLPPAPEPVDIDPVHLLAASAPGGSTGVNDVADLRYEVMYLLDASDDRIGAFKEAWRRLGDSIVVVGGDGEWNCHVHTNDIGGAVEAGIDVGRPHRIRVTDLFEEVEHREEMMLAGADDGFVTILNPAPATTAVVAVAAGAGVQRIFESLGVHAVIRGGQTMNPSTRQLVQAAEQVGAQQVVVLPNNKNIIPVAEQVDAQIGKRVVVVPTRSIAEGFASLLAFDPGADADTNALAMTEAAEAVVAGEVTQAVRASVTPAGQVNEGDWIGLDRSGVRSIGGSIVEAATALLDLLVTAEHELVTIIVGEGASPADAEAVESWLARHRADVEAEVHQGGQPLYPFYFGIE